jgi:hypothetical protein
MYPMNVELELLAQQLTQAKTPQDVFGEIPGSGEDLLVMLTKSYHTMVKVADPDLYKTPPEKILAHVTLGRLIEWFGRAKEEIKFGMYGHIDVPEIIIQTKKRVYPVEDKHIQSTAKEDMQAVE